MCDLLDGLKAPPLVGQVEGHEDKAPECADSFANTTGSRRCWKDLEDCKFFKKISRSL